MQTPKHQPQKGYYLLEYVLLLAIVGIILAAGTLRAPLINGIRLHQAKAQIVRELSRTTLLSKSYRATFGIQFITGSSEYRVFQYLNEQPPTSVRTRNLPTSVYVDAVRLGAVGRPRFIKFYPSGLATPAAIIIKAQNKACSIYVGLRGSLRTECD